MALKQLSVRFEPELLEKIELIANKEHRPIANQVVHFAAVGIDSYLERTRSWFEKIPEGGLTLKSAEPSHDH